MAIDADVQQLGDIGPRSQSLLNQPEQRQLTLKRPQSIGIEAEFQGPLLFEPLMSREPDFTKTPFAEFW